MLQNVIAILVTLALVVFLLGALILPYLAAINHVTFSVDTQLVTAVIAALAGTLSAIIMKRLRNGNDIDKS